MTEQEEDGQQLNQASYTAALLQDELIQAADRERQLQMQLDKMKDDVSQLQMQLEQLREEQEMRQRDCRFYFIYLFIRVSSQQDYRTV